MNTTHLLFRDKWPARDKVSLDHGDKTTLRGVVDIINPVTGKVILRKKQNLIVLRGRTFALEKLFDDTITTTNVPSYQTNLNRKICLFGVGTGGAPMADPFAPIPPVPLNEALSERAPFRTTCPGGSDPAFPTALDAGEELIYYDMVVDGIYEHYYGKRFEYLDPEWGVFPGDNEIYKKIVLRVNDKDARGKHINELMLYIAGYDSGANEMVDIEAFSHITFPTESLLDLTKQLLVEYYIYS